MKRSILISLVLLTGLAISSCNRAKKESTFIKKMALNKESIAVGIYKATGFDYPNIKYIAEALKIDGGLVYVTLTDADVLKTKLENIDVLIFPEMRKGQKVDEFDDEIAEIFRNFLSKRGKGAIGICNGGGILAKVEGCQTIDFANVEFKDSSLNDFNEGLIKFKLTPDGEKMFPELKEHNNLFIGFNHGLKMEVLDTNKVNILGLVDKNEINFPLFLAGKHGRGKMVITNTNPEITPGMRWMIPRMVRWTINKDFIYYDKNVLRPDLYNKQVNLTDETNIRIEKLLTQLDEGRKGDIISAMDELQKIYPWVAAEKVRSLLIEKNDDIKLRAAKYLVDIEYTMAIDDLNKVIKHERSRKVREKLINYRNELDAMVEQN